MWKPIERCHKSLLSLKEGHRPTEEFVSKLRAELPKRFPGTEFFFQPADIVTQILNFGLPAAIDVQFTGNNINANAALAAEVTKEIRTIPGAVDAHVHQRLDNPSIDMQMDRSRLQQLGLTATCLALLAGQPVTQAVYEVIVRELVKPLSRRA